MRFFNKKELIGLGIIFGILVIISVPNFALSIKRSRDTTRRTDLGTIVTAMQLYKETFGDYPASSDGKILACLKEGEEALIDGVTGRITNFIPCEWGKSSLYQNISAVPNDPHQSLGASYLYLSTGRHFQIFASLEAKDDDEYREEILKRSLKCGSRICNSGRSQGSTPLEKSLEEYEYELYAP